MKLEGEKKGEAWYTELRDVSHGYKNNPLVMKISRHCEINQLPHGDQEYLSGLKCLMPLIRQVRILVGI
jgi:hypothetical protein